MFMQPRILIVGAGPTGLTAAVELYRLGYAADIIEKRDGPSNLSRAVGILPRSMEIFARSGVDQDIRQAAIAVKAAHMHLGPERRLTLDMDVLDDPLQRLFCLAQDQTEKFLAAKLAEYGGRISYGHELQSITIKGNLAQVSINDEVSEYDYVIGADGTRSQVRESLGIAYEGIDVPDDWSIADVTAKNWRDPDAFQGFILDKGKVVIVAPLERNRFRVISNTVDGLKSLPVFMDVTNVRRSGTFKISVRQAVAYQTGPVFLAGDAAHCHSPAGGRGMNLGIEDAADLASRFKEGRLPGYHAHRHDVGKSVILETERLRKFLMGGGWVKHMVLGLAMKVLNRQPANKFAVAQLLGVQLEDTPFQ